MSVDVSFRTGNYQDYVSEIEHIPGCIYYLYEYNDPSDPNSGIKDTYVFLNDVQYNTGSGGGLSIIPMERFGSYVFNDQYDVGTITPDAATFRITKLQVTTVPQDNRDVANKKYVDDNTGKAYIIYSNDSTSTVETKINSYMNSNQRDLSNLIYQNNSTGSILYLSNIEFSGADLCKFNFTDVHEGTFRNYQIYCRFYHDNYSVIQRQYISYILTTDIDDGTSLGDNKLANVGQIKTYVESHTATWQTISGCSGSYVVLTKLRTYISYAE